MSSLDRYLECPGWSTVPTSLDPKRTNAILSAAHGSILHAAKEGITLPVPDLSHLSTEQQDVQAELLAGLEADKPHHRWLLDRYVGWEHEIHLGYRVSDHQVFRWPDELAKLVDTTSVDHKFTITGATDALLFDVEGNRVHLNDLKTGEHPVELDSPQLLGYGLWAVTWAVRNITGFDPRDLVLALSVLHWPRKGKHREDYLEQTGRPFDWYGRDVSLEELRHFRQRLIDMVPKAERGELEPGAHCVFCPGATSCPATRPPSSRKFKVYGV